MAPDASGLPSDDGATEITIEVWDNKDFYANAAQKFEEETGIKVNIINNNVEDGPSYEEAYVASRERIQAELMSGKGADIYAGIYLDFTDIGQNKHLCNLASWIAADPYFLDDAYYMNILQSGFDEGDVYSVPLFMMFWALVPIIEAPELEGQSLNWEEFFELTKGIKRSGVLYGITDHRLFTQRFKDRYDSFIDEENRTQSLNSPEMVGLLEQCREWSAAGLCIPFDAENYTEMWERAFFKEYGGGIELLTNIRFDNPYLNDELYYYDIPSDSGKNDKANKIFTTDLICINAASPYKGTAWRFVKFLLSEDIQLTGDYSTPVNRKAAAEVISKKLTEWIAYNQELWIEYNKTLTEGIEYYQPDIDPDQAIKETEAILDAVEEISDNDLTDIERIVFNEAKRYFRNEISVEEAAKNMAAGVALYFKEQ
jgi:ABC-type sugar transport system, periplasmic component